MYEIFTTQLTIIITMKIIDKISDKIAHRIIKVAKDIIHPDMVEGYRINYSNVYHAPCPYHGCNTYRTYVDSEYAYGPMCKKLLAIGD